MPKLPTDKSSKCFVTRDRDVRAAVMRKVLSDHILDPRVQVLEELGLEHGACRVDIAIINGLIHGYELKSDSDTISSDSRSRLPYSRALNKATLVVGEKHAEEATHLIPEWWEIKASYVGPRGAVHIENLRPASINPGFALSRRPFALEGRSSFHSRGARCQQEGLTRQQGELTICLTRGNPSCPFIAGAC
ncbi:MAG: hypothetical protein CPDRYMAC_5659 [uncultured Paraburkholderia sp.]|nr:MAG: hypothetical protein CPDRYDRY_5608 [uncultured Paraburkholderia sp.]CAH2941855.1 MAG: hypothetical protein CPDRYMAC_5659 [uncultured Paraburkholderia sp.]